MAKKSRKRQRSACEPTALPAEEDTTCPRGYGGLTESDFSCPICLELIIEPVVLPCKHEFCLACFQCHITETNLQCPLCRMRVSVWARRKGKQGTYVDVERWKLIQKLFPERCRKRLTGEEDSDYMSEIHKKVPFHIIAKEGEVRNEYESELKKIKVAEEVDMKKTSELIQQLQEEEDALRQQHLEQQAADELLARKLHEDLNKENEAASLNMTLRTAKVLSKHKPHNKLLKWLSSPQRAEEDHKDNLLVGRQSQAHGSKSDQELTDREFALHLQMQINKSPKRKQ